MVCSFPKILFPRPTNVIAKKDQARREVFAESASSSLKLESLGVGGWEFEGVLEVEVALEADEAPSLLFNLFRSCWALYWCC